MNRRNSPDAQVLAAMRNAKRDGLPPGEAWMLAVAGHVCDSYSSRRGTPQPQTPALDGPPNLRPAEPLERDADDLGGLEAQRRCAGCRHVIGAGRGPARCGLYEVPIYGGVLWPHRTDDRREWKTALADTAAEWIAAYADAPTPIGGMLDIIAIALADSEKAPEGKPPATAQHRGRALAA